MKIITAIASTLLLLANTVQASEDMVVYSEYYVMENYSYEEWRDVGLKWCAMQEEIAGMQALFPLHFVKGDETEMDLNDEKTRFTAKEDTFESVPCWEREGCGQWHVDHTADNKFHLYLCQDD